MKHAEILALTNPGSDLQRKGYVKINQTELVRNRVFEEDFARLQREADTLPVDHTQSGSGRSRRYGRMIYLPWLGSHTAVPARTYDHSGEYGLEYTQPAILNSEAAGKRRVLPALNEKTYKNRALVELIRFFKALLPFSPDDRAESMQIGVHLIKLRAGPGQSAYSSPNLVHRDGEPFTVAVLLGRNNVAGGENVVTAPEWHDSPIENVPPSGVLTKFTLEQPLDSYIVQDSRVAHYVGPVTSYDQCLPGVRTVLLLDFTPLKPSLIMVGTGDKIEFAKKIS